MTGGKVENLKIHVYEAGKAEPDKKITIPLSVLHLADKLIPKKTKASLEREGIELISLSELFGKKGPKGTLIEIESTSEKLVISID
jgi:hypothetical protein